MPQPGISRFISCRWTVGKVYEEFTATRTDMVCVAKHLAKYSFIRVLETPNP